ncbi:MAG: hypothetical protein H7A24_01130 [Leptospiraceae bacterium]|nr:hypothetical protein [Leptospiraceae bacterium]MCP5510455.1 hypothetical protein [Leptospiraceae bacterium]
MMIVRLATYFLVAILTIETLTAVAVSWSFYESVNSSLSLLKYTSDNKARDILATIVRVAETKMEPDGYKELNSFFQKLIKQSEKDLDKFLINEVFIVSNDGSLLSHNDINKLKIGASSQYNQAHYMRALRMRKGQMPAPQVVGDEYSGDGTYFGKILMKLFPDLRYQTILLSAPIYHTEKLEALATIHLVYSRGNVLFFINNQREILTWMLANFAVISFILAFVLWLIFVSFSFGTYRQAVRVTQANLEANSFAESPRSGTTQSKIKTILEKQEDTLHRFLTPIPARLDSNISLNILDAEELADEESKELKSGASSAENWKNQEKPVNPNEPVDAIFLD